GPPARLIGAPRARRPALRLSQRRTYVVAPAALRPLRRATGEQPRRLQLRLHLDHVALDGGLLARRGVVADRDPLAGQLLLDEVERGASDAHRHRGHDRAAGVEGRHGTLEALVTGALRGVLLDLGAAEQIAARDA